MLDEHSVSFLDQTGPRVSEVSQTLPLCSRKHVIKVSHSCVYDWQTKTGQLVRNIKTQTSLCKIYFLLYKTNKLPDKQMTSHISEQENSVQFSTN